MSLESQSKKPAILSILQHDLWVAPALGAFIAALVMTIIVLTVSSYLKNVKSVNPPAFVGMTVVFCIAPVFVSILRIRYVRKVFKNGVTVKAQIVEASAFRSNLRLTLRYTYLSQTHEKKSSRSLPVKPKN